jgi:methionine-S-sulfoxide reductase
MSEAIFAAGCFWGVQYYFDQVPGVKSSVVGYTGGHVPNPTYEQVCTHLTGHAEATKLEFDEKEVSYETLVRQFYRMHDPTQLNRQGPDVGDSYFKDPIVTQIVKAGPFYDAEAYHQKYAETTGRGMCHVEYAAV